jgi:uncharacterized lipoprotein YmbA
MKYLLIVLALTLSACGTTVPVVAKFPDEPGKAAMEKCPQLTTVENGVKLSELTKTVTVNYNTYYECAVKVDSWIEWYQIQKKIFEDLKK